MALKLDDKLVVGISSRALFDLEEENEIFEREGLKAYCEYQREHENDILQPGTAFPLVKALQKLVILTLLNIGFSFLLYLTIPYIDHPIDQKSR